MFIEVGTAEYEYEGGMGEKQVGGFG